MIDDELLDRAFTAIRQTIRAEEKNHRSDAELCAILAGACIAYMQHYKQVPGAGEFSSIDALRLAGCAIHIACALEGSVPEEVLQ